jgi:hypothetical protein
MKKTPKQPALKRLATLARKKKDFFKLLRDHREIALAEAKKSGIVLSAPDKIVLEALLTGGPVDLDLTNPGVQSRFKRKAVVFWDILCDLKGAGKSARSKR